MDGMQSIMQLYTGNLSCEPKMLSEKYSIAFIKSCILYYHFRLSRDIEPLSVINFKCAAILRFVSKTHAPFFVLLCFFFAVVRKLTCSNSVLRVSWWWHGTICCFNQQFNSNNCVLQGMCLLWPISNWTLIANLYFVYKLLSFASGAWLSPVREREKDSMFSGQLLLCVVWFDFCLQSSVCQIVCTLLD